MFIRAGCLTHQQQPFQTTTCCKQNIFYRMVNSIFKSIRSRKRAVDSVNTRQGEVDKERIDLEME
jgi:hypothetical protein